MSGKWADIRRGDKADKIYDRKADWLEDETEEEDE